ncbi:MAG: hypothetical protein ABW168_02820 [Sedimenticola sp.]
MEVKSRNAVIAIVTAFVSGGALAAVITFISTAYSKLNEAEVKEQIVAAKQQVMEEIYKTREVEQRKITSIVEEITTAKGKALNAVESAQTAIDSLDKVTQKVGDIKKDAEATFSQIAKIRKEVSGAANVDMEALANIVEPLINKRLAIQNAILAFNSKACPKGWKVYEPAEGRFLRGIDRNGGSDERGRAPGSIQDDTLQDHQHSIEPAKSAAHQPGSPAPHGYGSGPYGHNIESTKGVGGSARISGETRPKNVAVLFCVKQET